MGFEHLSSGSRGNYRTKVQSNIATIAYTYNDEIYNFNIIIGNMYLYEIILNKKKTLNENKIIFKNINNIMVKLYTLEQDEIDFKAYKNASTNIKEKFVDAYINDLIKNRSDNDFYKKDEYNSPPIY